MARTDSTPQEQPRVVQCVCGFATQLDGVTEVVPAGKRFQADAPIVLAHGVFFKPVDPSALVGLGDESLALAAARADVQ